MMLVIDRGSAARDESRYGSDVQMPADWELVNLSLGEFGLVSLVRKQISATYYVDETSARRRYLMAVRRPLVCMLTWFCTRPNEMFHEFQPAYAEQTPLPERKY